MDEINMLKFIDKYFSDKFSPLVRYLHYLILILVLFQIIISNFIEISDDGIISHNILEQYSTWAHISIGLLLFVLAILFIIIELSKHGFAYFYPYVFGDITQLKIDINQLKHKKMPELAPKGLAAIVQGLGLGALMLVVLSGAGWFLLWIYDFPLANYVIEIHVLLTGLIEAYVIAHGSIGLIHLLLAYKNKKV